MKKMIFPMLLCMISSNLVAQDHGAIEKTIRELEQLVVQGILNSDTMLLKMVWDEEFLVNTPRNTIAENREAVFTVARAGLIDYSFFERNIEQMQVENNVVITMGNELYVPRVDLPEAKAGETVKRRFTNVWALKDNNWKQIARHASVICE